MSVLVLFGCGSEGPSIADGPDAPATLATAPATTDPPTTTEPARLTTTSTVAPTVPPTEPPTPVSFTSPSGNIMCNASAAFVSCYISEKNWEIDAPAGCDFDWGHEINILAGGGRAEYGCYSDFSWNPGAPPLPYGESLTLGTLSCLSEETGMTCTEIQTGAEFTLSRAAGRISG